LAGLLLGRREFATIKKLYLVYIGGWVRLNGRPKDLGIV